MHAGCEIGGNRADLCCCPFKSSIGGAAGWSEPASNVSTRTERGKKVTSKSCNIESDHSRVTQPKPIRRRTEGRWRPLRTSYRVPCATPMAQLLVALLDSSLLRSSGGRTVSESERSLRFEACCSGGTCRSGGTRTGGWFARTMNGLEPSS